MQFLNNRVRVAKIMFSLGAVTGFVVIGAACLYGAAYGRHGNLWTIALTTFVPLSLLWLLFCYCAYKGLTSENIVLKIVFWAYVVCNVFTFPVGTAISGVSIWLWRDLRKNIRPAATT